MATEIRVPQMGESVVEATISRWLKKEGDRVNVGDPLLELETEKVNMEVGAEKAGVLQEILHGDGSDVRVGEVIGILADAVEAESAAPGAAQTPAEPSGEEKEPAPTAAPAEPAGSGRAKADKPSEREPLRRLAHGEKPGAAPKPQPPAEETRDYEPPRIRRDELLSGESSFRSPAEARAPREGVGGPPRALGAGGGSMRDHMEQYLAGQERRTAPPQRPPRPEAPAPGGREERIRMSRRRRTIARRLVEAQHDAAMLTTFNEINMAAVSDVRKRWREAFEQRHGVRLGFLSFFAKATVSALREFPHLNAEIEDDDLIIKHYYDIGIAMDTPEGLVVPVLRGVDKLPFAGIEKEITEFARKARGGELTLDDLRGGTFTITNGGVFGSMLSTPILNPPQVGILGLHRITERPVAEHGEVVIRPMMYVALSYDHRVVDGRVAVQFLVRIKEMIEDPERLLLEG